MSVLDIKENAADIEGCTLHFTAQSVQNLNGNRSLPVSWTAYVNCNELTWDTPTVSITKHVDETAHVEVSFTNNGGTQQVWTLSELPVWLTASQEEGAAEALTTTTIGFDIPQSVAIGTYEEDAIIGTHSNPLIVSFDKTGLDNIFVNAEDCDIQWYTVSGISLPCKPTELGVYICRKYDKRTQTVTTRKVFISK